ncbi:MAG: DUF1653 domain-containing protein [Burkholderiales bacterium]|nr:DUF1653 domain-containing protein [Burkholderiales bacterium]
MSSSSSLPPLPTLPTGRWQHHKGAFYEVLGVVRHSETLEALVLYRPLVGDGTLWVRPFDMFTESVDIQGQSIPRFKPAPQSEGA